MKALKGGLVVALMIMITACSTTPFDPHKPEMSVDRSPAQAKTYNQHRSEWEDQR